ncbi:hypothetical protein [Desulfogranum marinum]|uniref:hypothetical protein n=1 Tax=Desulfogranum marinum TaxID=453220 RepID=UPI0029C87F26|nr:hypothetical protein [Desulfogranum marinum]
MPQTTTTQSTVPVTFGPAFFRLIQGAASRHNMSVEAYIQHATFKQVSKGNPQNRLVVLSECLVQALGDNLPQDDEITFTLVNQL